MNARLLKLAKDYAKAYVTGTDAPEGTNGAYELLAMVAFTESDKFPEVVQMLERDFPIKHHGGKSFDEVRK